MKYSLKKNVEDIVDLISASFAGEKGWRCGLRGFVEMFNEVSIEMFNKVIIEIFTKPSLQSSTSIH